MLARWGTLLPHARCTPTPPAHLPAHPPPPQSAGELRLQKDISELDLPKNVSIRFPDGQVGACLSSLVWLGACVPSLVWVNCPV